MTNITEGSYNYYTGQSLVKTIFLLGLDQAVLALGTTLRRRNQDYVFRIAVCIVVTKIDGKRGARNDLG